MKRILLGLMLLCVGIWGMAFMVPIADEIIFFGVSALGLFFFIDEMISVIGGKFPQVRPDNLNDF